MTQRLASLGFALFLTTGLSTPPPGLAQVGRATVEVDGMACPFCAFGVEKRLRKVDGVGTVAVSSNQGLARITAREGDSIAVTQIPGAVKKAGFSAGEIRIEVAGTLTRDADGRTVLEPAATGQRFLLAPRDAGIKERLRQLAATGAAVRIEGPIRLEAGAVPRLSPESVNEAGR